MHDRTHGHTTIRGTVIGAGLILVGIAVLLTIVIGLIDQRCAADTDRWMPLYPGAEIVSQRYTFLRARGMGETQMTLRTPDDQQTVSNWYMQHTQSEANIDPDRGLATTSVRVVEHPDGGAQISLFSECAWR